MALILDISHHEAPSGINYDTLAKQVDFVIIRTQYGSRLIDRHYETHHKEFKKRGIPTAAYAWVRGISLKDMEQEAIDFYNRTKHLNPTFWFLDVEERSMNDMRAGVSRYLKKLRELGAQKVGIYIAHHLYADFNLKLDEADAIWIPHYGKNNGKVTSKPKYPCDIHQYTDRGRLSGTSYDLDFNRILSDKPLSYFTDTKGDSSTSTKEKPKEESNSKAKETNTNNNTYKVNTSLPGYYTSADAKARRDKRVTVKEGTYYVYKEANGMVNITNQKGEPGSWINPADNK